MIARSMALKSLHERSIVGLRVVSGMMVWSYNPKTPATLVPIEIVAAIKEAVRSVSIMRRYSAFPGVTARWLARAQRAALGNCFEGR